MDGQDRGHLDAGPGEVGRHKGCLPVIGMHQVGCPIPVQSARGKLGRGGRKAAETDVVVRPVLARFIAVGIAGPVIELWAEQDVDRQTVPRRRAAEHAGRHLRQRRALANDLNMRELFDDLPVSRQQNPDVGPGAERPGQGGRNGC